MWDRAQEIETLAERGRTDRPAPSSPEQVFYEHAGRVYNLARGMLGQEADAEDVAQEVLLQVVRKLGSFRGEAEFSTWLHRVTVNAVLLHRRKAAQRSEWHIGIPPDHLGNGPSAGPTLPQEAAPDRQVLNRELRELIQRAIDALPPLYRDVCVLADAQGLSNAEVGALLGLRPPTVKSRRHRARLLMREALAPYFAEACAGRGALT
jgi:RNA polymerase sigma-70 factor (ECF subfamily)